MDIGIQFGRWHPLLLGSYSVSPEANREDKMDLLECSVSVAWRASLCVFFFLFFCFSSSMCSEINSPFYSLADLRSANLAMKNQSKQSRQGANNLIHLYQRNNKNIVLLKWNILYEVEHVAVEFVFLSKSWSTWLIKIAVFIGCIIDGKCLNTI